MPPRDLDAPALDSGFILPLPQSLRGLACFLCHRPRSYWSLQPTHDVNGVELVYVCSRCFLYESLWGKAHREAVNRFILRVEAEASARTLNFERNTDGQLVDLTTCNNVLALITLADRSAKIALLRGSAEPVETR